MKYEGTSYEPQQPGRTVLLTVPGEISAQKSEDKLLQKTEDRRSVKKNQECQNIHEQLTFIKEHITCWLEVKQVVLVSQIFIIKVKSKVYSHSDF